MNFKKKRTFMKCLSALVSSVCVFQQPSVFAETLYTKGSDDVYTIQTKAKFNKLITNLPYDIKWKMVIDANKHSNDNKEKVYDENRLIVDNKTFCSLVNQLYTYMVCYHDASKNPGKLLGDYMEAFDARGLFHGKTVYGEKGYLEGMLNLWDFITKTLSEPNWCRLDSNKLLELHDRGVRNVSDKLTGFHNGWFPIVRSNSSYKGLLESFAARNSGFNFEQKVSNMLLKSELPNHEQAYGIDEVGTWEEPFDWVTEKNIYSLSGALPTLDIIQKDNEIKGIRPKRKRLRLKLTFGNTGLGEKYIDSSFDEFYKTLREIKSNSRFKLPKLDLSEGYRIFTTFLNEKFCKNNNSYEHEKKSMFKFLEKQYNQINNDYVSKSKNEKIIELIVRFCRALDQAHVFPDGNIRTYRMLMNMLLMQNGMLPAIYDDFNTLDCCSVEYLVYEVKQGQKKFVRLLKDNKNKIKEKVGIEI